MPNTDSPTNNRKSPVFEVIRFFQKMYPVNNAPVGTLIELSNNFLELSINYVIRVTYLRGQWSFQLQKNARKFREDTINLSTGHNFLDTRYGIISVAGRQNNRKCMWDEETKRRVQERHAYYDRN